jgi:hypothetical protein
VTSENEVPTPTTAADWKKTSPIQLQGAPITVPSGNVALCRRPGMQSIISVGIVPNSLMSIISQAVNGEEIDAEKLRKKSEELLSNPTLLADYLEMVDRIVCFSVIEPHVEMPPKDNADPRKPDQLYADEVDLEDKQFIFQWAVGGTANLETFREETERSMAAFRDGQNVQGPA